MLSHIITYGTILFYYSLFFLAIVIGHKCGSGQLKDVLSGKGELDTLMARFIAGIFFLGIGGSVLFAKRNIDSRIIDLSLNDYGLLVWILMALAIILGFLFTKPL